MAEKTTKIKKIATLKKTISPEGVKKERYFEAVGRRKSAIARVRIYTKKEGVEVNGKSLEKYFQIKRLVRRAIDPLEQMKIADKLGVVARVKSGGPTGQADAVRLGIARALVKFNPEFKKRLRRFGFLTRDARKVERKKYGLKKARRAPQWKKR